MRCPYCETENRDDREMCYHCGKDLSMLRLIANRAKNHYNNALEHAERGRLAEAVSELDNALQLNDRLLEAHLLRGTLLARLERPEEARHEWGRVLDASPASRRAHQYLQDLPQLERSLPLLRRLRTVMLASGAVALCAIGVTAAALWPSTEAQTLDGAWGAFARKDVGESIELLDRLARPLRDGDRERSARVLEQSIEELMESRLDRVRDHIARGELAEALEEIALLETWALTGPWRNAVDQQRALVRRLADENLAAAATGAFTAERYAAYQRAADRYTDLFPASTLARTLREQFAARGLSAMQGLLQEIDEALARRDDFTQAAMPLQRAEEIAKALGREREVEPRRLALRHAEVAAQIDTAERLAQTTDPVEVLELLATVDMEQAAPNARTRGEMLRERLRREARDAAAAAIGQALDSGDFGGALRAAERLDEQARGALGTDLLDRLEDARRRQALAGYYALMQRAEHFEREPLAQEDARDVLAMLDEIEGQLPATIAPAAADDLLFFRAVALDGLGREQDAWRVIQQLRADWPRSPYLLVWRDRMREAVH